MCLSIIIKSSLLIETNYCVKCDAGRILREEVACSNRGSKSETGSSRPRRHLVVYLRYLI